MNETEYAKWRQDADAALAPRFNARQRQIILTWFDNIHGSDEEALVGADAVRALSRYLAESNHFDMYSTLMARLFVYAPHILLAAQDPDISEQYFNASMTRTEVEAWERHARVALAGRYTPAEAAVLIEWFRYIKGQEERDLVGSDAVDAVLDFFKSENHYTPTYDTLMARLFLYAPFILKEAAEDESFGF